MPEHYYLGADLGVKHDHTAFAVISQMTGKDEKALVYLEQVPLGIDYPGIGNRIEEMVKAPELAGRVTVVVDSSGPGIPFYEYVKTKHLACPLKTLTIIGNGTARKTETGWNVPRQQLLSTLALELQRGTLKIAPSLRDLSKLMDELVGLQYRKRESAKMTLDAHGPGGHDDLAMAVALACWAAMKAETTIGFRGEPLF